MFSNLYTIKIKTINSNSLAITIGVNINSLVSTIGINSLIIIKQNTILNTLPPPTQAFNSQIIQQPNLNYQSEPQSNQNNNINVEKVVSGHVKS